MDARGLELQVLGLVSLAFQDLRPLLLLLALVLLAGGDVGQFAGRLRQPQLVGPPKSRLGARSGQLSHLSVSRRHWAKRARDAAGSFDGHQLGQLNATGFFRAPFPSGFPPSSPSLLASAVVPLMPLMPFLRRGTNTIHTRNLLPSLLSYSRSSVSSGAQTRFSRGLGDCCHQLLKSAQLHGLETTTMKAAAGPGWDVPSRPMAGRTSLLGGRIRV